MPVTPALRGIEDPWTSSARQPHGIKELHVQDKTEIRLRETQHQPLATTAHVLCVHTDACVRAHKHPENENTVWPDHGCPQSQHMGGRGGSWVPRISALGKKSPEDQKLKVRVIYKAVSKVKNITRYKEHK